MDAAIRSVLPAHAPTTLLTVGEGGASPPPVTASDDKDLDGGARREVLEEKIQVLRSAGELRPGVDAGAFQKHAIIISAAGAALFGESAARAGRR